MTDRDLQKKLFEIGGKEYSPKTGTVTENVKGDVNGDGKFDIADAVTLQNWILCKPDAELKEWKNADFCADDRIDTFDLCVMRSRLING